LNTTEEEEIANFKDEGSRISCITWIIPINMDHANGRSTM